MQDGRSTKPSKTSISSSTTVAVEAVIQNLLEALSDSESSEESSGDNAHVYNAHVRFAVCSEQTGYYFYSRNKPQTKSSKPFDGMVSSEW